MGEMAAPTRNLISVEEAQGLILEHVEPLPAEAVSLRDARGRVLAEPATAAVDLPPFDSSAMDGFALRSVDTPGRLPVAHRIAAGSPAPRGLETGEASPLPSRAPGAPASLPRCGGRRAGGRACPRSAARTRPSPSCRTAVDRPRRSQAPRAPC